MKIYRLRSIKTGIRFIPLLIFLLLFSLYSCKICKCPAYSKKGPEAEKVQWATAENRDGD